MRPAWSDAVRSDGRAVSKNLGPVTAERAAAFAGAAFVGSGFHAVFSISLQAGSVSFGTP